MSVTLYRKYRPQNFTQIVNQNHVKSTIQQELISDTLPHAFLFFGPRGVGKTTTARILAKALNCQNRKKEESEPCNTCDSCVQTTQGASMSLVEIDAASQTGVDNVRENIIANARVAVKSNEYKVFIIDEVHMLSTSSFNALLKTLEEPPQRVIFILATTEIHKIPETIISRCQRFDFHAIEKNILIDHLKDIVKKEKRKVDDDVLQAIVKKSGGFVRDSMSLLGQVLTLPGKITSKSATLILPQSNTQEIIQLAEHIKNKDLVLAITLVLDLEQSGIRPLHFMDQLIEFFHELLLAKIQQAQSTFEQEIQKDQLIMLMNFFDLNSFVRFIDILVKRREQMMDLNRGFMPLQLGLVDIINTNQSANVSSDTVSKQSPVSSAPIQPIKQVAKTSSSQVISARVKTTPSTESKKEVLQSKSSPEKKQVKETVLQENQNNSEIVNDEDLGKERISYNEIKGVWDGILSKINKKQHSLFIVLKTGVLRDSSQHIPEIAFKFSMHYDFVKRSQGVIQEELQEMFPDKSAKIEIVLDQQMNTEVKGDVEDTSEQEQEMIATEINRIADAFGGTILD